MENDNTDISKHLTFCTHLRYDNDDRVKNLQTVLNYYSREFPQAKFVLVEDDKEHNNIFEMIKFPKGTKLMFFKNDSWYYRTYALNVGALNSNTDIIVSLDTDAIVPKESIEKCARHILTNPNCAVAWPYNGYFIDTSYELHNEFIDSGFEFKTFLKYVPSLDKFQLLYRDNNFSVRCHPKKHQSVGGIVMFSRKNFYDMGGYNPKFIAWGAEDNELFDRVKILKYDYFRDEDDYAMCFHLYHQNALRNEHPFYQANFDEAGKVSKMAKEELKSYIKTWSMFNEENKTNV